MNEILKEEQGQRQEDLTTMLLNGQIGADSFIDELFFLDQSTSNRENAVKNCEVINRPQAKKILFEGCSSDSFNNFYSFTHFHLFQIYAHSGNLPGALEQLRISNEYASKIVNDKNWPIYVHATVLYFENKAAELKAVYEKMGVLNKEVVERLIKGLEKRGYPDYNEDY